jgi:hypothetical protein
MFPEAITIETSRAIREADTYAKWLRRYDALILAGVDADEAVSIIEAAQADERAIRRIAA